MNKQIKRGNLVQDTFGSRGVVVKIDIWDGELSHENHGTIYVWQIDETEYGADNCEHYPYFEWENCLTILED